MHLYLIFYFANRDLSNRIQNITIMETKNSNPHDLIRKEDVQMALAAEKGADSTLISYEIKDFMTKGENYSCLITSINVKYCKGSREYSTTYVAKVNPSNPGNFGEIIDTICSTEIGIYTVLLPLLNKELERKKEPKLRLPNCYHTIGEKGRQVIYFEDLRASGYKLNSRYKVLDEHHIRLIMKELGRFHAASVLLMSKNEYKNVDFTKKFSFLVDPLKMTQEAAGGAFANMTEIIADGACGFIDSNPGYNFVTEYIQEKKKELNSMMIKILTPHDSYKVIAHGDCWNNNYMFRFVVYDE